MSTSIFTPNDSFLTLLPLHIRDHLRDVPWEDIFELGASATATEFLE